MNQSKKPRLSDHVDEQMYSDSDGSSDGDDEITMDIDNVTEMIDQDLTGFPMDDGDYDGIRTLLKQLFTEKSCVNISTVSEELIRQNTIGSVLKHSNDDDVEDNEDTVFSFISCYSLTRTKSDEASASASLRNLLMSKCKQSTASREDKDQFVEILNKSKGNNGNISHCQSRIGFVFYERFINLPFDAAPNLFDCLLEEINSATTKMQNVRNDFTHYIMICEGNKAENSTSSEQVD